MKRPFTASVLLLVLLAPAAARAGLFDREDEDVAAGNRALEGGDAAEALRRYGAAAERHGEAPEVAFDRGAALLAAGKADEALQAFGEAIARREGGAATAADHAGIGTALASLGRTDEAKAELRKALELDPDQATARKNLEALLRREQREQQEPQRQQDQQQQAGNEPQQDQQQQAGNEPQQDQEQAGNEPQQDEQQQAGNEPQQDRQQQAGNEPQQEQQAGAGQPQASASPGSEPEEAVQAAPIDRTRAEQLLDALQQGERPYQLYRRQRERGGRTAHEKDW